MFDFVSGCPALVWLAIALILAIIEAMTLGLTTVWFAGGALIAAITALFTDIVWIQILVFIVSSLLLLYFTRPILVGKLKLGAEKTDLDLLIGKQGVVTEQISRLEPGAVRVSGKVWSALSESGDTIPAGSEVEIVRIEGVKLIVKIFE